MRVFVCACSAAGACLYMLCSWCRRLHALVSRRVRETRPFPVFLDTGSRERPERPRRAPFYAPTNAPAQCTRPCTDPRTNPHCLSAPQAGGHHCRIGLWLPLLVINPTCNTNTRTHPTLGPSFHQTGGWAPLPLRAAAAASGERGVCRAVGDGRLRRRAGRRAVCPQVCHPISAFLSFSTLYRNTMQRGHVLCS